ncbi:MAG TPA: hypothetical protein VIO60_06460 [Rectinemataceae bacterium]
MEVKYLIPLLILGAAGTTQYYLGSRQNRWMGKRISTQAEEILNPKDTEYVNIGGVIGYNFVYRLREPWKEAKGSFTFLPRHSMLYLPISYLIGSRDRFFLNLFTDRRLAGEGHIVEKRHLGRAKIDGVESMKRMEVSKGKKRFVLLYKEEGLKSALLKTLEAMADSDSLAHFCCYADNKTFFLFLKPRKGMVEDNLKTFLQICPEYFR